MCSRASRQQYPKHVGHTSEFVWRRLWGWDRCRLLSSHWSFQQSVWINWAWVKITMKARWKGVWRSPEYFVMDHTFDFLMSVFNQRVTDVLCVLLLYRQYKAPGGDCCWDLFLYKYIWIYWEAFSLCSHHVSVLKEKTAPLIQATCKVTAVVTLDVLVCFANCDCSVCQAHTTTGRCTKP